MKKYNFLFGFMFSFVLATAQNADNGEELLLPKKKVEFNSQLRIPDTSFYSPKTDWGKTPETYTFMDGNGGYNSYVVYETYVTVGKHYNSYFEIAPNCNSAINVPISKYDATDFSATLIYGILKDVLKVGPIKIGKTKIDW